MTERLSLEKITELEEVAYQIRRLSLEMITYARWGHPGGSFSMAEILAALFFNTMNVDLTHPGWEGRDRFILSKAHGSPALHAALALKGFFPIETVYTYCEPGGFEGHTDKVNTHGIEASGGPMGMGLSVAVGSAYGLRLKENPRSRVFCVHGDGELNEGNVWKAAMDVEGPVYFRVTRAVLPDLFGPGHTFKWGKGEVLRPGRDVSLFSTGMITCLCMKAAELLEREGIDAEVIHLASIKPIDAELIAASASKTGCAVSAENASILGGFGSAVAETLAETTPVPLARIGVRDRFVTSGGTGDLFRIHQMLPEDIAHSAQAVLARKSRRPA